MDLLDADKIQKNLSKKISQAKEIIYSYNPLLTLIQIELYKSINLISNPDGNIHGNITPGINKVSEFVQDIIVTSKLEFPTEKFISFKKTRKLMKLIEEIYILNTIYTHSLDKDEIIKFSQGIRTTVTGNLFPYFEKEHYEDLINPFDELCRQNFNLSSNEIVEGLLKISEKLRSLDMFYGVFDTNFNPEKFQPTDLLKIKSNFDVKTLTNWPEHFIETLALVPGELKDFYDSTIETITKEAAIQFKPFLKWNNSYYCFSVTTLIDNFYRSFRKALINENPRIDSQINNIQQELSESIPFKLLNKILPRAKYYKNIYYKAPTGENGKNQWCECDGIIIYDDVMIIVEIKSGALSSATPFSNENAYKKILKELSENPYYQTTRLYQEYVNHNRLEIFSKEKNKKYKLLTEIKGIKFIQSCCVTLENFNEIAAQIEKTNLISSFPIPIWSISIGDLRVYAEILNSPSHFFNFLYQRSKAIKNPWIKLYDELDHLGMYLAYNDYSIIIESMAEEYFKENGDTPVNFWIDNHHDEIDSYMAIKYREAVSRKSLDALLFRETGSNKIPSQDIPLDLQELIDLLDSSRETADIRVCRYILRFDLDTRNNISEFLNLKRKKLIQNRHKKGFYNPYAMFNYNNDKSTIIMIFILEASNKLFRDIVSRKRFLMERIPYPDKETYCVLVGLNKKGEFSKVLTHQIDSSAFSNIRDSDLVALNQAREKLGNHRTMQVWN